MVRKDPLNERGPVPPKGRPTKIEASPFPSTIFELRPEEEYKRLWASLIDTLIMQSTLIGLYSSVNMPGCPVEDLILLRDRLDTVIKKEDKSDEAD